MNRRAMMDEVFEALRAVLPSTAPAGDLIDCRHNYVAREVHFGESVWLTRKEAINAAKGVLGIVPGSMGAESFLVEGVGEPESFYSSAHGAGRRMGRRAAKARFTTAELARQTAGVLYRRDAGVLDEIPAAYKRIDRVIANQSDLTRTLHVFRQLLCVGGMAPEGS